MVKKNITHDTSLVIQGIKMSENASLINFFIDQKLENLCRFPR